MLMKAGLSTVLRAEHRFSGKRHTPATLFLEELMPFSFILRLLTLNALFATYGGAVITKPIRSSCLINTEERRWKSSCLYVVK